MCATQCICGLHPLAVCFALVRYLWWCIWQLHACCTLKRKCLTCIAKDDNESSVGQDTMQVSEKHYVVVDWLSMTQSERQCLAGRPHASLELPKHLSMWCGDGLLVVRDVQLNLAPVPQQPAGVLSEMPHHLCTQVWWLQVNVTQIAVYLICKAKRPCNSQWWADSWYHGSWGCNQMLQCIAMHMFGCRPLTAAVCMGCNLTWHHSASVPWAESSDWHAKHHLSLFSAVNTQV